MTVIAAADIGSSNCGLCTYDGQVFRASSWHAKEKGEQGDKLDYRMEARRLSEWRIYFYAFLIGEKIERLAVENPLHSNMSRSIKAKGEVAEHDSPAASMQVVYRTYNNVGAAIEIAERLNIPVTMLPNRKWFNSFTGISVTPKFDDDGKPIKDTRAWRKKKVRLECERAGIEVRNNDQGDASAMCFVFRGMCRLEGVATARPGDLLSALSR